MGQRITIMDYLRKETRIEHRRVELLPFVAALSASKLPLESYVAFLGALHTVHSNLEQAITCTEHPIWNTIWNDSLRLAPRLERDLSFFASRNVNKSPLVSIRAQLVAQRIRQRTQDDPLSLLGYLYVLEGATLGGTVLKGQVAETFGLAGSDGLAYLSSHTDNSDSPWARFRRHMNDAAIDDAERRRIVEAANEAFSLMAQIIEAVYPFEASDPRMLARTLNWEAGYHSVPQDEREIHAAMCAGERSWRRFPYYNLRYGKRGERFTRSDSAWLVTLADHSQAIIEKQMVWLGQVLSARGMPQWMLETHLEVLHEALVAAVPENAATYDKLLQAANMLGHKRRQYIQDDVMEECGAAFKRSVGDEWSAKLPEAGQLLAAAVADEKLGIRLALSSVETWMTDAKRFPPHWADAVGMTIRMARASMR